MGKGSLVYITLSNMTQLKTFTFNIVQVWFMGRGAQTPSFPGPGKQPWFKGLYLPVPEMGGGGKQGQQGWSV